MNLVSTINQNKVKLELETISNMLKITKDFDVRENIINEFKNKIKTSNKYIYDLNEILKNGELDLHIKLFLEEEEEVVFLKVKRVNRKTKAITGKVSLTNNEFYREEALMIVGLENISDIVVL